MTYFKWDTNMDLFAHCHGYGHGIFIKLSGIERIEDLNICM